MEAPHQPDAASVFQAARVAELNAQHAAALRRFLEARYPGDGEDLAQEVWQRALEKLPAAVDNPRAWLFAVGRRLGIDRVDRKRRPDAMSEGQEATIMDPLAPTPLEHLLGTERAAQLRRCLSSLRDDERALFIGRHIERRSHAELAGQLGINENISAQRISRAKDKLKRCMEAELS